MTRHISVVLLDDVTGALRGPDLELLTVARTLGPVRAVAFEAPSADALAALGTYGVADVVHLDVDGEPHLTGVAAAALAPVLTDARVLLARATFANKEVLARLAHLTGAGLLIDAARVGEHDGLVAGWKRVFAGSWDVDSVVTTELALLTVRPNAVRPVPADAPADPVVRAVALDAAAAEAAAGGVRLVSRTLHETSGSARPPLAEASVVVAGGRGTLGDFGPVEDLADALGAAIGATRDAVDEGWIDHDAQVGQTGVTITPHLYIGAGISGAPHHRGGMQASEVIVAVNSDPECPIFEICDFAVVGDLATVLPQAAAALRARTA
ncbi:electron transfer flavoprotein subunit alpha/FixB family protein [Flavimobilis sp. GY10621]|uniref:Electron transfer flavoprotein subunit alpha/FixB family protein n=1 Tax=Flavimobilis rhizosphaerae TaxID=2775421 RepID=A0ABR9DRB4_9MICO|nr:electron transfer flavoprotein subunit alpha/FixB family protein [Flavimobilis rhizosphaerae]MBD9698515.1 electron transfer flavoprotein subunit alpha/FixB family protein [Flavimobilis rhizosphaerae]